MLNVIRQWVIKTMMKNNTGVVQTLPKKDLIELNTQITAQRLMQNGVDPQALKNADQVENVINTIESSEKKNLAKNIREGVMATDGSRSAKVFDMEGNKINTSKGIMGGKEINQKNLNEELMKTDNPYSDLVNTPRPKTIKEREAEVLAGMEKNNKEAVQRIRNRKMVEEAIDNASPGFAGDRKYDAQLVADDLAEKRFGKDFYDLDQKQQLDLYDEAYTGLSDSRFKNKPDPEDMATGGRAGYMNGTLPMKKDGFFISPDFSKMTPEEREIYKLQMERMKKGFEKKLSPEGLEKLKIQQQIREQQRKDMGLPEEIQLMATGGRAGFKAGLGKRFLELLKGKPKPKFDVERFREGPIDLKFLENIDKKDLAPFIRSRDTMGPGGYGMYDDFADLPAGLKAAELIKTMKGPRNEINYKAAELFLGKKLKGNESADELIQMLNRQEMRADGGRIGLKAGMTKRAFLKLMGGVGAGIAGLKSGLLGIGKGAGKKAVEKVAINSSTLSAPPPYFFELANKIKTLGKPDKVTYADRVEIHRYRGKNGDEYELIEDLNTGDMKIQKDKTGVGTYGDKSFDTIEDRSVLEYRKGETGVKDEGMETQKSFKEADEYEEYKVEFDADGTEADATELDAVVQKEIIEEATGDAPSIKKAGGGIARMLGE